VRLHRSAHMKWLCGPEHILFGIKVVCIDREMLKLDLSLHSRMLSAYPLKHYWPLLLLWKLGTKFILEFSN